MYIDEKYEITGYLPGVLKRDIEEIEDFYKQDDWIGFDCALETLEATVKQCRISGRISQEQMNTIFKRYGLG